MIARVLWTAWLLLLAGPAWACTCSNAPPGACPGLQKDDVVFLGVVTSAETLPPEAPANSTGAATDEAPVVRYHFRIEQEFAGPDTPEMDIYSGGDDGDCGYRFQNGQEYLVFTHQDTEGRLFATICNGTRPASEARAIIPQLRAMRDGRRVASVFGVLRRADPPSLAPPDDPEDPLPNVSLKLRSVYDRFETSSGQNGVYSFYDVHAGTYRFYANLPARMELTQKTLAGALPPFKIPDGACYEYDVDALPTGHIRGSVLGPGGKPLPLASVELFRAGQYDDSHPGLWGFQGAKGNFDFDHIGPGEYILVFNRTNRLDPNSPFARSFYPGVADVTDAKPIKLKDSQQLLNLKLQLKKAYPTRLIRVRVKWQGARPPGTVTIMAQADQGDNPAAQKIADGLYQFTVLESAHYTISAWEDLDPRRGVAACALPDRIATPAVAVGGPKPRAGADVTLIFPHPECVKQ
ncbi:MAG: hypothetical protein WA663_05880 [Candidatus Acidiferrales bacterium]